MLVAETDAVIRYLTVISGKPLVTAGASVKKGDLLISGYISGSGLQYTDDPILRYDGAAGEVLGEIRDKITVFVPFAEESETVTVLNQSGIRISLLGMEIDLGEYSGDEAHTVAPEKNLTVFGAIELPITVSECYLLKKQTEITLRDELQATNEAKKRAYRVLSDALDGAILTESVLETAVEENGITVTVSYGCIKNVAVPKDIRE